MRGAKKGIVREDTPLSPNPVLRGAARGVARLLGWRFVGALPDAPKYVLIGAPHTSNWDWAMMILAGAYFGIRPYWMGKKELFPGPIGWFMRALHGIPVERDSRHNMVEQMVRAFRERERMVLIIAPEGTRSWVPKWRTGFYRIAEGAGVPIVLAYLDFRRKEVGIGPTLNPTGDLEADLRQIAAFYADKTGKHPENAGPVLPG